MQTSNRILDDLARVANGAVSTLVGIKNEIDALVRQRIERLLNDADVVPREEFDAVKAMAAKARTEQEKLEKRIAGLEAKLGVKPAARTAKSTAKSTAKARKSAATKKKSAARRRPGKR
ncbi:MAG: accessory factor UbiK family protein [Proteobacteria bacterium]|nr:accessory factor UbiK family protein [Pseudomonadota bacterium]